MIKSELLQLFYALSKEDLRILPKFIRSPRYNKRQDVVRLFDYIHKNLAKNDKWMRKQLVFESVFPGEEFDDKKWRYTMSYLLKRMEQYLITKTATGNEIDQQLHLANAYSSLKLEKGFNRAKEIASKLIEKSTCKASDYYEQAYRLEFEKYIFTEGQERNAPRNLQELSQSLDLAYLSKKLKQSCLSLAHQAVYNVDYDDGLLKLVLNFLSENDFLDNHPTIACYFYYYKAEVSDQPHIYFEKLKKIIDRHLNLFPEDEKRIIYLMATNYCIKQINKGNEQYLLEIFNLYKSGLKNKTLLEHGYLSRFSFKNIVQTGLRLKEYDWTEQFITEQQSKLETKYQENYTHYNLSKLLYAKKNYQEAMMKLHQVEYDDFFLNLDAKILLLKIYYELGEFEALDSFLISFHRFLKRKKLIAYHQENYLNTIRLTSKLLRLNPYDKEAKVILRKEVEETQVLGEKNWLLEQLA